MTTFSMFPHRVARQVALGLLLSTGLALGAPPPGPGAPAEAAQDLEAIAGYRGRLADPARVPPVELEPEALPVLVDHLERSGHPPLGFELLRLAPGAGPCPLIELERRFNEERLEEGAGQGLLGHQGHYSILRRTDDEAGERPHYLRRQAGSERGYREAGSPSGTGDSLITALHVLCLGCPPGPETIAEWRRVVAAALSAQQIRAILGRQRAVPAAGGTGAGGPLPGLESKGGPGFSAIGPRDGAVPMELNPGPPLRMASPPGGHLRSRLRERFPQAREALQVLAPVLEPMERAHALMGQLYQWQAEWVAQLASARRESGAEARCEDLLTQVMKCEARLRTGGQHEGCMLLPALQQACLARAGEVLRLKQSRTPAGEVPVRRTAQALRHKLKLRAERKLVQDMLLIHRHLGREWDRDAGGLAWTHWRRGPAPAEGERLPELLLGFEPDPGQPDPFFAEQRAHGMVFLDAAAREARAAALAGLDLAWFEEAPPAPRGPEARAAGRSPTLPSTVATAAGRLERRGRKLEVEAKAHQRNLERREQARLRAEARRGEEPGPEGPAHPAPAPVAALPQEPVPLPAGLSKAARRRLRERRAGQGPVAPSAPPPSAEAWARPAPLDGEPRAQSEQAVPPCVAEPGSRTAFAGAPDPAPPAVPAAAPGGPTQASTTLSKAAKRHLRERRAGRVPGLRAGSPPARRPEAAPPASHAPAAPLAPPRNRGLLVAPMTSGQGRPALGMAARVHDWLHNPVLRPHYLAALAGDARAMLELARCYRDGRGGVRDPWESRRWLERAAARLEGQRLGGIRMPPWPGSGQAEHGPGEGVQELDERIGGFHGALDLAFGRGAQEAGVQFGQPDQIVVPAE